jgi:cell division protein FtsL
MNPVKLAWPNTKNCVRENSMTALKWLIILTAEGVVTMTQKTRKVTSGMWKTEKQY